MFEKISFLINLLLASFGVGVLLLAFGATTLGGSVLFGGAAVVYLWFMLMH